MQFENEITPTNILLVEDNPGDIKLTLKALEKSKLALKIEVLTDGEEALRYLNKEDKYKNAKTPDLVLLDLNLPKVDGFEILKEIKTNDKTRLIPVVIITTSTQDEDIAKAYSEYANCYITKPVGFNKFKEIIEKLEEFWFTIVKIPKVSE